MDHVPPIQMFAKRQRPKGLETPSCTLCNRGAREAESLASMLASVRFGRMSESDFQHFSELVRHVSSNFPHLYEALEPKATQRVRMRKLSEAVGEELAALDLRDPRVNRNLLLFGAKCGLALHWHERKQPLPHSGKVVVMMFSNEQAVTGDVPQHLFSLLPDSRTLAQGKMNVADRFEYSSCCTTDSDGTAHWVTFGHAFAYNLFVGSTIDPGPVEEKFIFRPGCLAAE